MLNEERKLDVDKVFLKEQGEDVLVSCPVCGCEFNHIYPSKFEEGNDNYESSSTRYRGDTIIIPMVCEESHNWNLCFSFHKGNTFTYVRL